MRNMHEIVGHCDIVFITLDTLRYDVAVDELAAGRLPSLGRFIQRWEKRHSPGNFTYASHQAFFGGFLPTPAEPGLHPRLFALQFPGSETTADGTFVFQAESIVAGLAGEGYHTMCVGGVGFFNGLPGLGSVLPSYFQESHWTQETSVAHPESTRHQVDWCLRRLDELDTKDTSRRVFLFVNVSALHDPNHYYRDDYAGTDDPAIPRNSKSGHAAALRYADHELGRLFERLARRGRWFAIVCSDHGTAYGDDGGYEGHRNGSEVVWTVPYADFIIEERP